MDSNHLRQVVPDGLPEGARTQSSGCPLNALADLLTVIELLRTYKVLGLSSGQCSALQVGREPSHRVLEPATYGTAEAALQGWQWCSLACCLKAPIAHSFCPTVNSSYIQTYELRLVNSTKVIKLRGGHCVSFSKVDSTRHAGEHIPDMFQLAAILCHS
jgi:hypothetical protein